MTSQGPNHLSLLYCFQLQMWVSTLRNSKAWENILMIQELPLSSFYLLFSSSATMDTDISIRTVASRKAEETSIVHFPQENFSFQACSKSKAKINLLWRGPA